MKEREGGGGGGLRLCVHLPIRQKYFYYKQSPNSGPKKWMNAQSIAIPGSENPLKSLFESEIRVKTFSKSTDPLAYTEYLWRRYENQTGGLLFTQKNCDFGAISVTERNCTAPISKMESHIDDRCSYYRGNQRKFSENICSEDDLRSRIFGAFVVEFLACLPLLGFSNMYKMV